jgi:beta-glucosidase
MLPSRNGRESVCDILFGDVNPSGRLPYNYPRYPNSLEKYNENIRESLGDEEQNNDATYEKATPHNLNLEPIILHHF